MMVADLEIFQDDDNEEESFATSEDLSDDTSDEEEEDAADPIAEQEIEGDFDRLVQGIRLHDGSSNALTKEWDLNFIAEKEAEFRDDLREASGVGRKRKRKGRTAGPVLSHQVKALIGDGNQAYVDNNLPEAIRLMNEVIRIEPRAADAWSVLAQCHEDIGDKPRALVLRIMAAHLRHDADEWDRLARQSRECGYNQQALYCYRKVSSLDPSNVDAFWDRAALAKEIGDFRTARHSFLSILKRFPHDLTVLRELHTVLVELNDLSTCASLLQQAFDHHQNTQPSGPGAQASGAFNRLDILLLSDLYNALGQHERAVDVIRRGTRWLQGREEQRYWDLCEDDREYDIFGWPPRTLVGEGGSIEPGYFELDTNARHRLAVARIKMGDADEGKLHANAVLSEDVLDYAVLFAEIADAYFEREMYDEAKPIYEMLGADPATSSIFILMQTAACMRNLEELREAAEVYEHIRLADPTHNDAKMKLAEIYEILGEPRRALDLVYEVIDSRKKRKTGTQSQNPDEGTSSINANNTASLFTEEKLTVKTKAVTVRAQNRLTHSQLRELEMQKEREVAKAYSRMKELWQQAVRGEDEDSEREWMYEAEKLVDMFRETRNLFVTSRANPFRGMFPRRKRQVETEADEDRMASRLQLDLERDSLARKSKNAVDKSASVDIFRGISFDDWLRLIIQYAFLLTKRNQYELADEVLRHIMVSNAYQHRERQNTVRLALITCAIAAQQYTIVVEQCRKLITQHQFNNEPLRILLASISSGYRPTDAFITSTLQKHLFREMKLADVAVRSPETLKWNALNRRYAPTKADNKGDDGTGMEAEDDQDGDGDICESSEIGGGAKEDSEKAGAGSANADRPEIPTKHNPLIVTIYGQICIAAKSYQSAIFYLLHAYDYAPDDPMISLCLAIASIGRAMQRQSDNRHHLITQAMAFLSQYRNARGTDARGVREVEYNFGRTFQQLGLYSYAVKHYERVLEMAEKDADEMYAKEAAYNLSLIFTFTGAIPLADQLYRRWLSI